ncbi:MAG: ABC transporter ATP-binding protein, partial [bacterium]
SIQIYRRLLRYARPYFGTLAISALAMLGLAATSAAAALLFKNILDDVFINKDRTMLVLVPIALLVIYFLRGIFRYFRAYLMDLAGIKIVRDIRNDLYAHYQRLSMSYFTDTPTGIMMSRVTFDVSQIQSAITNALTGAVRDVFTVIALAGVVIYRNPYLGVIALISTPLAFYPMVQFGRRMKKASTKSQEQIGELNKLLQENISGIELVKAFGTEEKEMAKFREGNEHLVHAFLRIQRIKALSNPVMEFIGGASAALIIWLGGLLVMRGSMTVGEFFSFLAALFMMYDPVKHLNSVNNLIQAGIAAAERVFEVMDTSPEIADAPDAKDLSWVEGRIQFENVSFRYGEDWILRNMNLQISRGEKLAIVGTSGGGKTTLVNLIPRFFDVNEGAIKVDGQDVRSVTQKSLRSQISIVSQEVILFNDTVRYNICYGIDGVSDEEISRAVKAAYAEDFIESMPEGLETIVGERGTKLSGGQRQRLSIARAILKDSPILILDEATSSLDTESEYLVAKALENLMRGRTTIVIAHRIST